MAGGKSSRKPVILISTGILFLVAAVAAFAIMINREFRKSAPEPPRKYSEPANSVGGTSPESNQFSIPGGKLSTESQSSGDDDDEPEGKSQKGFVPENPDQKTTRTEINPAELGTIPVATPVNDRTGTSPETNTIEIKN
jgi:hypothetical protein